MTTDKQNVDFSARSEIEKKYILISRQTAVKNGMLIFRHNRMILLKRKNRFGNNF